MKKCIYIPEAINRLENLTWTQKRLLAIITGLSQKGRPCYASNPWLAEELKKTTHYISENITDLVKSKLLIRASTRNAPRRLLFSFVTNPKKDIESLIQTSESLKKCTKNKISDAQKSTIPDVEIHNANHIAMWKNPTTYNIPKVKNNSRIINTPICSLLINEKRQTSSETKFPQDDNNGCKIFSNKLNDAVENPMENIIDIAQDLAEILLFKVLQLAPDYFGKSFCKNKLSQKTKIKQWSNEFKKMMTLDGRDMEETLDLLEWLFTDRFWSERIRCAKTMRNSWSAIRDAKLMAEKKTKKVEIQRFLENSVQHLFVEEYCKNILKISLDRFYKSATLYDIENFNKATLIATEYVERLKLYCKLKNVPKYFTECLQEIKKRNGRPIKSWHYACENIWATEFTQYYDTIFS